ncbi:MAG: universal stress protein [Candidatus Hydrogenedentes bacterium]|nr:universal stress protein [Candidatus Hydrogenedentota bacterium]MBI3119434.1 universal stress protein [Candidatus Hydrogenedentota bacterium]
MIKRILVPTDGSEAAMIGVTYAVALGKTCDASLLGLHVVDVKLLEGPFLRDISASLGTAPYINYQGNIAALLEERGAAALRAFQKECEAAGVPAETAQVTGIIARAIVEKGDLADLIVMGRGGEHNEWLEGLVGSTTEAVVRRAHQPVLVTGTATPGRGRLVVAYDGTRHARTALKTAATLSVEWSMALHLLVVGDSKMNAIMEEALGYLDAHKTQRECIRREGDPGETIVAYAAECNADLLVMGAFGHSKVRELVVGSTTTYAINRAPCPVLLAR